MAFSPSCNCPKVTSVRAIVCLLVGVLSPVNHRGLVRGTRVPCGIATAKSPCGTDMSCVIFQSVGHPRITVRTCSKLILTSAHIFLLSHLVYLLTARIVGAPQMISQPVSSIFPVLHCPVGLGELQVCSFPDVVFPPLSLSALSSSPFHCALQDGFGQT